MALRSYTAGAPSIRPPVLTTDPLDHVLALMYLSLISKFEFFELSEQLPRPGQCVVERGVGYDLGVTLANLERRAEITFEPKANEPTMDIVVRFIHTHEEDETEASRWSVPLRSMSIMHTAFTEISKAIYSFMGTATTGLKKVPTVTHIR